MSRSLRPILERVDRIGIRPLPLVAVLICGAVALLGSSSRHRQLVVPAVTDGASSPQVLSWTAQLDVVHVSVGQKVRRGDLLATLSAPDLQAQKAEIEAEIESVVRSERLAQLELDQAVRDAQRDTSELLVEARRDRQLALARRERQDAETALANELAKQAQGLLSQGLLASTDAAESKVTAAKQGGQRAESEAILRAELARIASLEQGSEAPSDVNALRAATSRLHEAELSVLVARRQFVDAQLAELSLRAKTGGVVSEVLARGTLVAAGTPVMWIVPHFASEVVAFLDSAASPSDHTGEVSYTVALADGQVCTGQGTLRSSGRVEAKPSQLSGPLGMLGSGFPLRVRLQESCRLAIGQLVELRTARL